MGNKRKVLFIIDSLTCGGAEKSLISLLPLLDYSKVQIDLMLVERGGVFEQYIPTDVNVVDFPRSQTLFFRVTQLCFSILLKVLRRRHGAEVRWLTMNKAYDNLKEEYDVAVAYQQGFPTYYVAEKVQAKRKYAWVNADLSKAGYNEQYNHQFYHVYDKVVPVSDILCDMLRGTGYVDSTKLYTVYDILNVDLIWKMSREPFEGSSCHEVKIVTTGRLAPPKNHILAVETAAILKRREWILYGILWVKVRKESV